MFQPPVVRPCRRHGEEVQPPRPVAIAMSAGPRVNADRLPARQEAEERLSNLTLGLVIGPFQVHVGVTSSDDGALGARRSQQSAQDRHLLPGWEVERDETGRLRAVGMRSPGGHRAPRGEGAPFGDGPRRVIAAPLCGPPRAPVLAGDAATPRCAKSPPFPVAAVV
eukprot:8858726-Lingulodinium_polyedra.AAC.1